MIRRVIREVVFASLWIAIAIGMLNIYFSTLAPVAVCRPAPEVWLPQPKTKIWM